MKNQFKKYVLKIAISLILIQLIVGCVQSGVGNPNDKVEITITSPTTGDSVQIGENTILYKISNPAAIALDHFEIILNNGDSVRIVKAKDNLNGTRLLLGVDSSLISTTVSYYVNVATKNNVFTTSEVQSNLFVTENRNPPAAPTNLTLTKLGGTTTTFSTNLEWVDNADNETTYELWRKEGSSPYGTTPYKIFSANTQRINDDGLSRFVVYSYKVSAKNKYGRSKFSNEVNTADQPDESPTNLKATALGATKVHLTWDDNAIAKLGYRIQRSDLTSTQYVQVALVTTKEYLDINLSPRTAYSYRVQSFTSTTESNWTNPVNATTLASDVPPPANLIAVFDSTTKFVTVSWIDNTFLETGTSIERKKGLNGSYSEIGTTNTDVNVFVDQAVPPGFIYVYRAKYSTTLGFDTDYSNEAQVYVPDLPPAAPSNLVISTITPNVSYLLNWQLNSTDEDGVEVWRKGGALGQYQLVQVLAAKTTANIVSVPNSSIIYYFKIRAVRNSLVSGFSNEVGTDGSSGSNDITLSGGATSSTSIQITWTDVSSSNLGFSIERKISWEQDTAFKIIKQVGSAILFFDDTGLQASTTYSYRVRAIFSQGYSNYSNVKNITTNP